MTRRSMAAAMSVAIVLGGGALATPAAATWSSARMIDHRILGVAGNARGEQAFSWTVARERVQSGDTRRVVAFPQVLLRRADGRLLSPLTLTRRHAIAAYGGAVGLDGRGAATALWSELRHGSVRLMASVRPPGGSFGPGSDLGRIKSTIDYDHVLAVARDGAAVVLWHAGDRVYAAQRPPGRCARRAPRACFGPTQTLARIQCPDELEDDCVGHPDFALALAPGGRAFATWPMLQRVGDGYRTEVKLAAARPGHRFGRAVTLARPDDGVGGARIARLRDGGAVATWIEGYNSPSSFRIVAQRLDPDGRPRSPASVLSGPSCVAPHLAVNPRDEVTIAWYCVHDRRSDGYTIGAWAGSAGAPFAPGIDFGHREFGSQDALGVDGAGNTLLVYGVAGTTTLTRVRPPGGAFGPPQAVPSLPGRQAPWVPGGRLVEAGRRLTLVQWGFDETSQLRDWTP